MSEMSPRVLGTSGSSVQAWASFRGQCTTSVSSASSAQRPTPPAGLPPWPSGTSEETVVWLEQTVPCQTCVWSPGAGQIRGARWHPASSQTSWTAPSSGRSPCWSIKLAHSPSACPGPHLPNRWPDLLYQHQAPLRRAGRESGRTVCLDETPQSQGVTPATAWHVSCWWGPRSLEGQLRPGQTWAGSAPGSSPLHPSFYSQSFTLIFKTMVFEVSCYLNLKILGWKKKWDNFLPIP